MARADLTTAELRSASARAHRRRRFLAAWIRLFAFVLQFGFSLGTAASSGKPIPGSLAADLAALCLDATDGTGSGSETASHPCDHCRLCGSSFVYLPAADRSSAPRPALRIVSAEAIQSASSRRTLSSEFPRAPPL